jgi:N-acetylmuramoyl-L-alanine amidase
LQEDALAWAVAKEVQRQLPVSKYKVVLTKSSANACPGYRERGRWAIQERAKAFISIHMNAPNVMLGVEIPFANGTSVIYNSGSPGAVKLAEALARSVSSSLGINNRGVKVNNGLTVLQPDVTPVNAVLLEAARLSGRDELILHERDSAARIAAAIKATLDAELQD